MYRTTKRVSTGETPFSLAYGTEAFVPVDICMPMLLTGEINPDQSVVQLCLSQYQSKERRREAQIRIVAHQQQIKASHHKVKPCKFQVGDLVLKLVIQSTKERNEGKLGPNWEGPYFVMARR